MTYAMASFDTMTNYYVFFLDIFQQKVEEERRKQQDLLKQKMELVIYSFLTKSTGS